MEVIPVDLKEMWKPLEGEWNEDIHGIHSFLRMQQALNHKSPFRYKNLADFVLRCGRPFEAGPRHKYPQGAPNQCFMNAYNLMADHRLKYVEGYATCHRALFPIVHAWNLDSKGRVVDNTWMNLHPTGYYGVVFSSGFVRRAAISSLVYGILENLRLMRLTDMYPLSCKSQAWKCRSKRVLGSR